MYIVESTELSSSSANKRKECGIPHDGYVLVCIRCKRAWVMLLMSSRATKRNERTKLTISKVTRRRALAKALAGEISET